MLLHISRPSMGCGYRHSLFLSHDSMPAQVGEGAGPLASPVRLPLKTVQCLMYLSPHPFPPSAIAQIIVNLYRNRMVSFEILSCLLRFFPRPFSELVCIYCIMRA
ncbi:hypothetical protein BDZ91DRAFT_730603 [Kalaharituber pfeilii]|nr:hypothetical protein BDZ91DRAFT_730603 [Kalaharituber pfeilii]